jgi:acyl carrier protein
MSKVREEVVSLVAELCRPEEPDLSDESRSLLDSGLDSLDFASLLMALEDKFDVSIGDDDLPNLRSLGGIIRFVEERQG